MSSTTLQSWSWATWAGTTTEGCEVCRILALVVSVVRCAESRLLDACIVEISVAMC